MLGMTPIASSPLASYLSNQVIAAGIAASTLLGSPTVTPGPVTVDYTDQAIVSGAALGQPQLTLNIELAGFVSASLGEPTVIQGPGLIVAQGFGGATLGQPQLTMHIELKPTPRTTLLGAPSIVVDATLAFDPDIQSRREFAATAEQQDPSRVSPFVNGAGEILYYGSVICFDVEEAAAQRLTFVKPDSTNLYDCAGIVAGTFIEGHNVPDGGQGYRYIGGLCLARVLGDASCVKGSVLKVVSGQYYLDRDTSPGQMNSFVIKEDHLTATEELKLVHVKLPI